MYSQTAQSFGSRTLQAPPAQHDDPQRDADALHALTELFPHLKLAALQALSELFPIAPLRRP